MVIHFSILALIIILSLIYEKRIRTAKIDAALTGDGGYIFKSQLLPWLILFIYISILAGLRTDVNDSLVYIEMFDKIKPSWDTIRTIISDSSQDKGFFIIGALFKIYISKDYHWWFFTVASFCSVCFVHVFRRYSVSFFDACFFFFCTTLYFNFFSMMRQWLAVAIYLLAIKYIHKKKLIPYIIVCLIAAQFHTSAYVMIIVYFLVKGEAWSKKQVIIVLGSIAILLFLNPLLTSLSSSSEGIVNEYANKALESNAGASIIRPIIYSIPVIISFWLRKNISDSFASILINMALINFILNILAVFTNGLYVIRLAVYFSVLVTLLYPFLLNVVLKDNKYQRIIKSGYYILYFAYYCYQMTYSNSWYFYSDILGGFY